MAPKSGKNGWNADDLKRLGEDEVSLSTKIEYERFSVSLPTVEAQQLREAAKGGSISQKVRDAVQTQLFCEEIIEEGGEIYAVTKDGEVKRLRL